MEANDRLMRAPNLGRYLGEAHQALEIQFSGQGALLDLSSCFARVIIVLRSPLASAAFTSAMT